LAKKVVTIKEYRKKKKPRRVGGVELPEDIGNPPQTSGLTTLQHKKNKREKRFGVGAGEPRAGKPGGKKSFR